MSSSEHSGEPTPTDQPSTSPAPEGATAPAISPAPDSATPLGGSGTDNPPPLAPPAAQAPVADPAPAPIREVVEVIRYVPNEVDVPLRALLALLVIGMGVWMIFSWAKYDKTAAQTEQGWHKGTKQIIELTLVREDRDRLSCASNLTLEGGLNCGYDATSQPRVPTPDPAHLLQPYCNTKNEVLLGAGLWDSPSLRGALPTERFTVACNFDIVGVIKSVSTRWETNGRFDPAKQALPAGTLTDCVIPQ